MNNLEMKFFYALLLIILPCLIEAQNYCRVCSDHTMCRYRQINSLGKCNRILARGVNQNDVNIILQKHNQLRSRLAKGQENRGVGGGQPSARNMRKMRWNSELATIAQRWVDQCHYDHDSCRNTESKSVGQNLYISYNSANQGNQADFSTGITKFWDEVDYFSRNNIQRYRFSKIYGHYSQMAWADTYEIGCGYIHYFVNNRYTKYHACNYGPTGNYGGSEMYKIGSPCSACPPGTRCNQGTKLCE